MCDAKYTFLLPAYKSKYLRRALKSIQDQTYKGFKVIISDDCSPEDLLSICRPFLYDSRFSLRRNQFNYGSENLVNHWNMLVGLCQTDYLIMASDDDVYANTFLEEIDKLTHKYSNSHLFRARTSIIDSKDYTIHTEDNFCELVSQEEFLKEMHTTSFVFCVGNLVFCRNGLIKNGCFESFPMAAYSDNATMIKMSKDGCVNTSIPVFYFRHHASQLSSSVRSYNSRMKCLAGLKYDKWIKQRIEVRSNIYQLHKNRTKVLVWEDMYHCNLRDTMYCLLKVLLCNYLSTRKLSRFLWCKVSGRKSMY